MPAPALMVAGYLFGLLAMPFMGKRRKVIRANLKACFPGRSALWRMAVAIGHQAMLGRFLLDHALLLGAGARRMRRLVTVEGMENIEALGGQGAILLAPHTVGIDHGGVRLCMDHPFATLYARQKSRGAEHLVLRSRTRLAKRICMIANIGNAMAQVARILKGGGLFYYLNDIDKAHRSKSVFVPFLGHEKTGTLTTLPRLARLTGAAVVPCVSTAKAFGGYKLVIGKPWADFPSGDDEKDMRRYNDFVGEVAMKNPTQYYWPHRRFKNRPEGEPDIYA